jgi:NTE family protein
MNDHWQSGYDDAATTLKHQEIFERPLDKEGVFTFDLTREN